MTPKLPPLLPEMVSIPEGNFTMGAGAFDRFANDTERPAHEVHISAFGLAKHPVTAAQYSCFQLQIPPSGDTALPVVNVSWHDAQNYCAWLSTETRQPFRLPTEAEWEYACRAGSLTAFAKGDDLSAEDANFLFDEQGRRVGCGTPTPAGSYAPNAFGLHDMHGNVCEWVADGWHPSYANAPQDGAAWAGSGEEHVIRGGAWDYMPRLMRSAWRDHLPASTTRDNVGFRVATSDFKIPDNHPDT